MRYGKRIRKDGGSAVTHLEVVNLLKRSKPGV
jgi:hypothetical protein